MGRLVAPFSLSVPEGRAWYLVYRAFRETDPALMAFRGRPRQHFTEKPQS
jgi:LysR family glycine cleavage system transcriptional activator/LysR family transcriptional regulator of beta-lactamase